MNRFEFNSLSEAMAFIKGLKAAINQNIIFDEKKCTIKQMIGTVVVEIQNGNSQNK
jgi:hypothetical protein